MNAKKQQPHILVAAWIQDLAHRSQRLNDPLEWHRKLALMQSIEALSGSDLKQVELEIQRLKNKEKEANPQRQNFIDQASPQSSDIQMAKFKL